MKKKLIFYLLATVLIVASGCYKDKGNYNYLDFGDVAIQIRSSFNATIGDTMRLTATVTELSTGDTMRFYDPNLYEYEWRIGNDIHGTEKDLVEVCNLPTGITYGRFSIINKSTKERTMGTFYVNVTSQINIGWLILSDLNNNSNISYVKWENALSATDFFYTGFPNIYKDEPGTKPIKLIEHYGQNGGESEVLLIQEGGPGPVEISGKTMQWVINTSDEFLNKKFPDGVFPLDVAYYGSANYLLGSDFNLYSRQTPNSQPPSVIQHNMFYSPFPVVVSGGAKFTRMVHSSWQTQTMVFYDDLNKRFLGVVNNPDNADFWEVIPQPVPDDPINFPKGFTPTNNYGSTKIIYSDMTDRYPQETRCILKTDDGEYRLQIFQVSNPLFTQTLVCQPVSEKILPIGSYLTEQSQFQNMYDRQFLLFTGGANNDKIYFYNKITGAIGIYKDFGGQRIAKIRMSLSPGNLLRAHRQLGVGLEGGIFKVFDAEDAAVVSGSPEELFSISELGDIKDVIFKANTFASSFHQAM